MVRFMSELIRNEMVVQLCDVFQRLNFTDSVIGLWSFNASFSTLSLQVYFVYS